MPLIKTEFDNLLRDTNSKAIIVSDNKAKEEYKRKMQEKQKIENMFCDIENLKQCAAEINNLRNELSEIKQLILSINNNKVE